MEDIACKYECFEGCWYWMPDSIKKCVGYQNCKGYEKKMNKKFNVGVATPLKENQVWDDKFGMIGRTAFELNGVGEDAEIITNANGGKQSKPPMALHLVDPQFLIDYICTIDEYRESFDNICNFMMNGEKDWLVEAIKHLAEEENKEGLVEIGKVLQYGAGKYAANNWRLIPEEEHINHALIHYYAYIKGDTQDDHFGHCVCRLMMAYATEKSKNFDYNIYIPMGA